MSELMPFTRAQVAARRGPEDAAVIIDNVVYGVAGFLDEHPGGPEVLLANAGRDASQCFSDIGHSEEALALRGTFAIGEIVAEERWAPATPRRPAPPVPPAPPPGARASLLALADVWAQPLALAALATLGYWYLFS